jgi:hypothetical protein
MVRAEGLDLIDAMKNFDLLEAQVRSIVRGPHLRLCTALQIADMHHKLDQAEAMVREGASALGLDHTAPMSVLRQQLRWATPA